MIGYSDYRERNVEPELPLPRKESHEHRAVQRAPHPTERLDRAEHAQGTRQRAFGIHVSHDRERHGHHRTAPDCGEHAAEQERTERRRCRDDDRPDDEQRVCRDERAPPADDVADAAGDRHDRDERDEVGVDDPGGVIEAVGKPQPKVADDRAQHRGDDCEVVGSNENREADGCQHGAW